MINRYIDHPVNWHFTLFELLSIKFRVNVAPITAGDATTRSVLSSHCFLFIFSKWIGPIHQRFTFTSFGSRFVRLANLARSRVPRDTRHLRSRRYRSREGKKQTRNFIAHRGGVIATGRSSLGTIGRRAYYQGGQSLDTNGEERLLFAPFGRDGNDLFFRATSATERSVVSVT